MGAAEILVNGCTGEIPGDCYIPKNKLYVKVYDLKKTDLNLTILNSASFTTTGIKNYFNDILKQAAYKIENLLVSTAPYYSKSDYDKNGNDCLDLWISNTIPTDDEFKDLKNSSMMNNYWSISQPGIVIVENNIRMHVSLQNDEMINSKWITLEGDCSFFTVGEMIQIGSNNGTTDIESMYISSVNAGSYSTTLGVKRSASDNLGMRYSHPKLSHSVWHDGKIKGLCDETDNFAALGDNATFRVAVHEFLHMTVSGKLKHVVDNDNIMNTDINLSGTMLRYREVANPEGLGNQKQWSLITGTNY